MVVHSRLLIDMISSKQTLKSSQCGLGLWWWDLWDGPKGYFVKSNPGMWG